MVSLRFIYVKAASVVLLLLAAGSAYAQQGWSTYVGMLTINGEERKVALSLTREALGVWQGGKKVVTGWRYQGTLSKAYEPDTTVIADTVQAVDVPPVDDMAADTAGEFSYPLFGLSQGESHSVADSTEVMLTVKSVESTIARISGRFDTDTTFSGIWKTFDGDHGLQPFTFRLEGEWTDEEYIPWYDADFIEFWQRFREAIRTRDSETIASITRFPVMIGSCVPLKQTTSQTTASDVPLNRKNLLKKFDRVFDSLTTAHLTGMDAAEAGVYEFWAEPGDKLARVLKGKILHWMVDPSGRRFEFARINDRYMLVRVSCENLDGGC